MGDCFASSLKRNFSVKGICTYIGVCMCTFTQKTQLNININGEQNINMNINMLMHELTKFNN